MEEYRRNYNREVAQMIKNNIDKNGFYKCNNCWVYSRNYELGDGYIICCNCGIGLGIMHHSTSW